MAKDKKRAYMPWWLPYAVPMVIFAIMMIFIIADKPEYTVTFSPGYDGGKDKTETAERKDTLALPDDIYRPGYTFAGWWYKDEDGWRLWDFENDKVLGDMKLTARWERVSYTITLDANGGECGTTAYTVAAGETFKLPVPTKGGYYFAGWYCGEFKFDKGTYPYNCDCNVKAKWTTYPPGMTVKIGRFEQDGNLENGAEEIEWHVVDYKDGKYFLVSKYLLTEMRYAENARDTAWETSLIRTYLNGKFLETAFSEQERQYVTSTLLPEGTTDCVFLLNKRDIEDIVIDFYMCIGLPSDYLLAQGVRVSNKQVHDMDPDKIYHTTWYYIRGNIKADGTWFGGYDSQSLVRPAMWIDEEYVDKYN